MEPFKYFGRNQPGGLIASLLVILAVGGCASSSQHCSFQATQAAAARGQAKAEYDLARHYARGDGVPQDYSLAVKYLRQSAEQGYADAETDLGSYYAHGLGVEKNLLIALEWYRKAAAKREPLAEYCLGYAYAHGEGVPQNLVVALEWWEKSAKQGQADAQNALGQSYFHHQIPGNTNRMNDYAPAAKWLRLAAEQGYVSSMNNLAFLYQNGLGVRLDLAEARKWYGVAAHEGDAMAQANLGLMYEEGAGIPSDLVEAYKWFVLSAEQGNAVGLRSRFDYDENHRLTPEQLARAQRMVAEFHAQNQAKPLE